MNLDSSIVRDIIKECKMASINYCILRNYEEIPDEIRHDIDILLDKKDYHNFMNVIEGIRDKYALSLRKVWEKDGFYTYILFCFEGKTIRQLKLDIWVDLHWRGIAWIDTQYVLATKEPFRETYKPSSGCEAAISMIKELLGGGNVAQKYYTKIKDGVQKEEERFITALQPVWGKNVYFFIENVQKENWEEINAFKKKCKVCLLRYSFIRGKIFDHVLQNLKTVLSKVARFVRDRGKLVAVIGPDGSGKSTVIDAVKKDLRLLYPQISVYHTRLGLFPELHTGLGLSNLKRKNKSMLLEMDSKKGKEKVERTEEEAEKEQSLISKIVSILVLFYYTLEFVVGRPVIRSKQGENSLILFDRYYYDFFVQENTRNLIWGCRRLLCKLVPDPDYVFHLYADGRTVFERKGELNCGEIDIQNEILERLLKGKKGYFKLDTREYDQKICKEFITQIIIEGSSFL